MSGYDIFLSHSEQDKRLINKIAHALLNLNLNVYVEELENNYGSNVVDSVTKAINESDYFLVILTEESTKSQWVNQEIGYAFALEKSIIPVRVGKVNVTGMINEVKAIKSSGEQDIEIIPKILSFFIDEYNIETFVVTCKKCGNEEEWELPNNKDRYNWSNKNKPMICDCGNCKYNIEINPITLLYTDYI